MLKTALQGAFFVSMTFSFQTKGFNDIIDITSQVLEIVKKSKVKEGLCLISCPGSTCGITTLEYEEGLIEDLKRVLEQIAPMSKDYKHCQKWPARNASLARNAVRPHRYAKRCGRVSTAGWPSDAGGGDCNGYAHIRSALINPFLSVAIENGELVLGQWQQLIFIDFDNRPREREIMVKVISS